MTTPGNTIRERARFHENALASGLVDEVQLSAAEAAVAIAPSQAEPDAWDQAVADQLVEAKILTKFQAREILAGRRRFRLGQYTVLDEVARGGMGHVFRAEHAMMGREVAVKVLPRAKAFQGEMRMLGRLDHENLVRAFDAGYDAMVYYLVTELVPGLDLKRQVLKHGPLDEVLAASVISQAARGLAYAHDQEIVHRDVKPGNILVTPEGRVKVLDLGLAGSQIEEESSRLGRVVGTMDYIAPEQVRTPDDVGPTADIYALGCTLYYAVTGQVPFPGGTRREKMQRQLSETPTPPGQLAPQLSRDFCRLIDDMMAKDPARRIQSATDVIERLRRWTPTPPPPMPRRKRGSKGSDRDSSSELLPLPDEAVRGGGLFSWGSEPPPLGRPEDDPLWPASPEEFPAPFTPPIQGASVGLSGRAAAGARALLAATVGGVGCAAVAAALQHLDPERFTTLLQGLGPGGVGFAAFVVLLVAQAITVSGSRR
jgi:eukaryotic-like serine/threonine-protein kinase